jgi:predicted Ser/Thr protein kinase
MPANAGFDRALDAVADGQAVDWHALERLASDDGERERVRCLQLLGKIADLHRSTEDPLGDVMAETIDTDPGAADAPLWGRYQLLEKVGEGGFGQVFRAWDSELEREIAIKILHAHIADDRSRDRLRQEGRALAQIRQPNVVNVVGIEVHEGRAGLCMEFVRGQTLDELVRARGTFSAREATLIGEDVCRALSAVHRAGYLHRDVKAKNVMREQEGGRIVLMDFGTGRQERASARFAGSDMTGTPLYMAPEVLLGDSASARSDVYSVGVLLFFLVTGTYPIPAHSTTELNAAHREGRRRLLSESRSDLPASFVRLVERALAPKPAERHQSAAALLEALGSALVDEDVQPVGWVERWVRRIVVAVPLTALVLLGLGSLTSVAFNNTLERAGFVSETIWERAMWGLKACVLQAFVLLLGWLGQAVLLALWRVSTSVSPRVKAVDEWMRARFAPLRRDPAVLASGVLLLSTFALLAAWSYFWPLIDALTTRVSTAPADLIAILAPDFAEHHDLYRQVFSWLAVGTIVAWYVVSRLAERVGVTLSRGVVAGVIVVVCLQLGSLAISYRLLIHNTSEAVHWRDQTCYVTGQRPEDVLIFCPGAAPPRNKVVSRRDAAFERLGRTESVFTGLGSK